MNNKKYRWICTTCGSDNVSCSAILTWDYKTQNWIAGDPLDDSFCEDCSDERTIEPLYDGDPNPYIEEHAE